MSVFVGFALLTFSIASACGMLKNLNSAPFIYVLEK